jgi:hypothetical protein
MAAAVLVVSMFTWLVMLASVETDTLTVADRSIVAPLPDPVGDQLRVAGMLKLKEVMIAHPLPGGVAITSDGRTIAIEKE